MRAELRRGPAKPRDGTRRRRRRCDEVEVLPQLLGGHLETGNRSAHHMLADSQPALGCDDNPIRVEGAMKNPGRVFLQRGQPGRQLAEQPDRERRAPRLLHRLREAKPRRVGRNRGQPVLVSEALERPD